MKKSLYYNLILGYVLFGIISFLIINLLTSDYVKKFFITERAKLLYDKVNVIANDCSINRYDVLFQDDDYTKHLDTISKSIQSQILIIRSDGEIVYDSNGKTMPLTINAFDPADYGGSYYKIDNFYQFSTTDVLSVVSPINRNYTIPAYVIALSQTDSIRYNHIGILNYIYSTFIILFFASMIILIIFTYTVYFPLKKISEASHEYAKGNLEYEGLTAIKTDDEIGRLSASLHYMATELKESEEYQKKFIANISHDFRSPLTSIQGYVKAMMDGTIPYEMQDKYLGIVISETERLNKLTSNLLTLNTWDAKEKRLELTDFDINEIIKNTTTVFEGKCAKKKLMIDLTFGERFYFVTADSAKIEQVIYNLLDNAIKFSGNNSEIKIQVIDKNEKVFVSIKDSGTGIPKENLSKIWDRFYKTDLSRGKDKTGIGLGLSIVKEAIQLHNEHINVVSTPDIGTEFIFTLQKARRST